MSAKPSSSLAGCYAMPRHGSSSMLLSRPDGLSRTPPNWHSHTGLYDGQEARHYQSPWMRGMYVGQLDSEQVRFQGNGGYRCSSCCRTKSRHVADLPLPHSLPCSTLLPLQPGHVYPGWSPNRDPKSKCEPAVRLLGYRLGHCGWH